ncbi:hypothetical protein KAR91_76395 [Candidatus Pacearchaeota archaeon]|nr:hypothetical protein [Candidatus Pacearchaeota archaeon]
MTYKDLEDIKKTFEKISIQPGIFSVRKLPERSEYDYGLFRDDYLLTVGTKEMLNGILAHG